MFTLGKLLARPSARSQGGASSFAISANTWTVRGVWGLWLIGFIWTAIFIARHGHNLPANDEWVFVPITYASWSEKIQWIGERHMEHRFPLARFIYLGLLEATDYDYRAGMWMTLGLLGALRRRAYMAAPCRLRGHTSIADSAFVFLFLHVGHTENLLMGYQIAFTITVLALSLFALLVAYSDTMPASRAAAWGALCLVTIALGGWLGLVFVPAVGLWVGWQAWRGEPDGQAVRNRPDHRRGRVPGMVGLHAAQAQGRCRAIERPDTCGSHPQHGRSDCDWTRLRRGSFSCIAASDCLDAHRIRGHDRLLPGWNRLASARRTRDRLGVPDAPDGRLGLRNCDRILATSGTSSRYAAFSALGIAVPFLAAARYLPVGTATGQPHRPAWRLLRRMLRT